MEHIKIIIYACLPMAIIFLIINNIVSAKNYAKRSLILSILFIGNLMLFGGAMIYDYLKFGSSQFTHYQYFLAAAAMLLINLGFIIYNLIQAFRNHHKITNANSYQKDINQYLYIVYKFGGMYYLRKERNDSKEVYLGDCVIFERGVFFYDEAFSSYISKLGVSINDYSYVGSATANKKKKMVFYCFLVDLADDNNLENFERISPYEIVNLEMLDLHKTLIMHILIGKEFNIEL